ncbi:MAG: type II toxin-antitoxin system PemK/MazF family toxin [Acidobacteriota bacterium]
MPKRMAAPSGWFPKRGEICLFALDKERPALVISSDILNRHALDVCVIPLTTAEHRAFRLRPKLRAGEAGLDRDSWVKCDQVTTVDKRRVVYPALGVVSRASMQRVEAAVLDALELRAGP